MSKPLKVGVTGGIGSGKSLICQIFVKLGVPIYDADSRAKWLMNNSPDIKKDIIKAFGKDSYKQGQLNRDYLADYVFNDDKKLKILNSIVHPAVGEDYMSWVGQQKDHAYVVNEAALMFEANVDKRIDKVINVSAPEEVKIERILSRDPFRTREEIQAIMNKQLTDKAREKRSDFTIVNDGKNMILPQVIELHYLFSKTHLNNNTDI